MTKFIGIIPARYASSRFPGKPLADICGMTMIERVYRQASKELDDVVVATDDERIARTVEAFGGRVAMTSESHRSGTDRCREAYHIVGSSADVVINIQGDEPFIDPAQIAELKQCFDSPATDIATLVRPFDATGSYEELADPNRPKVVLGDDMSALYFSRSVVPYLRNHPREEWPRRAQYYTHVGMYAYRADVLESITSLPQSTLELAESLEQLRWLQAGYRIRVGITTCATVGIDTPDDLRHAIEFCKKSNGDNA
ncbi:3-deoxy-manno-octulosonate cytidylyltransferase [uncultured Muribaculum sp.]|uniref:3-deoxy-manno-octulosonate cytidylyltransferase n=1 Tax=uncultured Muribaculum sp. TaxID=1918613 RepID=UPI0025DB1647|nr:3-deoxy-manno-octulosonate cytidylyltransferase [uncultured Muribaculum sp.]